MKKHGFEVHVLLFFKREIERERGEWLIWGGREEGDGGEEMGEKLREKVEVMLSDDC